MKATQLRRRSVRFRYVVPFTRSVEPYAHDAPGGGIIERLIGPVPIGLWPFGLAVTAHEDTDNEEHQKDQNNDDSDHDVSTRSRT